MKSSRSRPRPWLTGALLGLVALAGLLLVGRAQAAVPPDRAELVARAIHWTNQERQKAGLPPLTASPQLSRAAQTYVDQMSSGDCWDHDCPPEPDPVQRIVNAGYTDPHSWGENLYREWGYDSTAAAERAVAWWMGSPSHRANILSPNHRDVGLGVASNGQYDFLWVQNFGARADGGDPDPEPEPPCNPPQASIKAKLNKKVPRQVVFTTKLIAKKRCPVTSVTLGFGDGQIAPPNPANPIGKIAHTYAISGPKTATLRVAHGGPSASQVQESVTVNVP